MRPERDARLFRFLFRRLTEGVAGAWCLLLGLLWTDVGGLAGLIDRSPEGWLALLMLAGAFGLTGGAVAMGLGVMSLARSDEG